ncbi:MAG: hypothetical protein ACFFAH_05535 [Promethearchaeota archaeon]
MIIYIIQNDSTEEDTDEDTDDDTDYECKITEDSELTWKYTKFDPILIQNLSDIYNIDLISLNDIGAKEGSIIEYKIEDIENFEDKWRLEISYESDEISGENTQELKIYKDPKDVPNSWIYNIEDLSLRILPSETQDYLDEIKENFKSTESVDIERNSDLSLAIYQYMNYTAVFTEFRYNDNGIIEKFTLIFFDSIALEYILEDYSLNDVIDENLDSFKITVAAIISSTILIMIPLYGYVLSRNNRAHKNISCQKSSELNSPSNSNNKYLNTNKSDISSNCGEYNAINRNYIVNHQKKEEIKGNYAKLKKIKYLFCELCGTRIDEDAIYCHYCGNKLCYSK